MNKPGIKITSTKIKGKTEQNNYDTLSLAVTRMGSRWIAKMTLNGKEVDTMACALKSDIGWICREMLRWHDKLGGRSAWASSARRRQHVKPNGKTWTMDKLTLDRSSSAAPARRSQGKLSKPAYS